MTANGQDEGALMKTIMGKLASVDDPEHMQELALLAIDMMLRRAEDKPLRNLLIWRVHIAISSLLNEGSTAIDPTRRREAVQSFAELLRAAREQRQPREVVMLQNNRSDAEPPETAATPIKPSSVSWPILVMVLLVLAALVAGLFALASPAAMLSSSGPTPVTAAGLAAQIEAAPAMDGAALHPNSDGTRFYLARSQDDRPIVVAEDVPRRLCAATGWALARDGAVTVNGAVPAQLSKVSVSALCYRSGGNATLTWSPAH
jgi:hypothetical protein